MNSDSKSGLCMRQVLASVMILVVVSSFINLFASNNTELQVASLNIQEDAILENIEEVQVAQQVVERDVETTSRASVERTIENKETEEAQEEKTKYISIEEVKISRDMDLTQRTGLSKEDFKTLMTNLRADTSGFFETNSDTIYDLCEKYEINEIFFCGLIAGESGWNIASNHRNTNNYISMMSGGKLIRYSTVEEGLEAAAKLLHKTYLSEGGSCYYGKTLSCVQRRFCPNSSTWVGLIYSCMDQIV